MRRRSALAAIAGGLLLSRASAAKPKKRVVYLAILDIDEKDEPGLVKQLLDQRIGKPLADLGWRDGVNLELVPHIIPMRTKNWDGVLPRAALEVANGNYDGAIVEG